MAAWLETVIARAVCVGVLTLGLAPLDTARGSGLASPAPMTLPQDEVDAIRSRAADIGAAARAAVQPLPEGQLKVLEAVVMSVQGRPRWRPEPGAPLRVLAVDDVLKPGVTIRTGVRASVALRVGHNATILVDRMSAVTLPQIIQVGSTLRTAAQVRRGRVDIKVDRVGLTNDFTVVTPSTTLAVRGTGYAVSYGGLGGTQVFAARTNRLRAIEVRYFLSRFGYSLSGGATSTETQQNPAVASLFKTFGPPRILSALIEDETTPERLDETFERLPTQEVMFRVDRGVGGGDPSTGEPPPLFPGIDRDEVAAFICENLFVIFLEYDEQMVGDFGADGTGRGFRFEGLNEVFNELGDICNDAETFDEEVLGALVERVEAYCDRTFDERANVDRCIANFVESVVRQHDVRR